MPNDILRGPGHRPAQDVIDLRALPVGERRGQR